MALSFDTKNEALATSMTLPTHAAGQLLIMFAFRNGSATAPTVPSGWTSIGVNTNGAFNSCVTAVKVAKSSSETSGTWTNASGLICHVMTGANFSRIPLIRHAGAGGTGTTVNYSGITTMDDAGNSWGLRFSGTSVTDSALETAPSGFTNRSNISGSGIEMAGFDTNGTTSSVSFAGVSVGGSSGNWVTQTIEVLVDKSTSGLTAKANQVAGASSTGSQTISDPGFQPKAIIVMNGQQASTGGAANAQMNVGIATPYTTQFSSGYNSLDNVGTSDITRYNSSTNIINTLDAGATTNALIAPLTAFTNSGFTLNWTTLDTASPLLNYLALGGQDITNVYSGSVALNTSTGNQSVTGVGFQPDIVIFSGTIHASFAAQQNASQYFFGAIDASGNQWSVTQKSQHSSAAANTNRAFSDQAHVIMTQTAADNFAHKQSYVSMDSDGFTFNIGTAVGLASIVEFLAIKGGSWKVGTDTQKTSTGTKATTGIGFTPKGVIFGSVGDTGTDAVATNARLSLGFSTGASNNVAIWTGDEDAADPMVANSYMTNSAAIVAATAGTSATPTVAALGKIDSFSSGTFTIDWTTADATARRFGYIAFGDNYVAPAGNAKNLLLLGVG